MSLCTDLSAFTVIQSEDCHGGATLTSAAISKSGTYFAVGDEKGNIFLYKTTTRELARNFFLDGTVHILQFVQMRSKTMLLAATTLGHLKAWQVNEQGNLIRWQKSYPVCVNAIAVNTRKDRLAVSVGLQVHLYYDPWELGAVSTILKTWSPATPTTGGKTFYKSPLAIGLHFTASNDLLISYFAGHCLVRTKEPYNVVYKAAPQLPSRISHVSLSPNGKYAVSMNLNNGFEVFDLENGEFTGTHDYLSAPSSANLREDNHIIQSSFLNETFLVTGHHDPFVCISEFKGEAFGIPFKIEVADAEPGYGVRQLAAGVYKRKPFIVALTGEGRESQFHFIASPFFDEERKLKLAPAALKQDHTNRANLCQRMITMFSLLLIYAGLTLLVLAVIRARGFL